MNVLLTFVVVIQVLAALTIIGLVLLQHGKGADMGAAFGSGASGSLFGASGSSNFLSKSTGVAAAVFFSATLALAFMGNRGTNNEGVGVMGNLPAASPASQIPAVEQNQQSSTESSAPVSQQAPNSGNAAGEIPK